LRPDSKPGRRPSSGRLRRYIEERIYVADPRLVLGDFSSRRFEQSFDEDDEDDDGSFADDHDDPGAKAWDDSALADDLRTRAAAVTSARIGHGGGGQAFIMTTTPHAAHLPMAEVGSQVAFIDE
jgi:hypothetical protein